MQVALPAGIVAARVTCENKYINTLRDMGLREEGTPYTPNPEDVEGRLMWHSSAAIVALFRQENNDLLRQAKLGEGESHVDG